MFPACEERIDRKYGKWGRVLGKGTGGTVRLIQGPPRTGGKVFAVKEFRKKKSKETEFEYRRMIATECCFANGLRHVNVIETVDIVRNKSRYFQVMEYAPYDLFSVVMSGRMVQPEVYCVFRQICDGVAYLHSTGLAHRDLKLENCVMTNGNVVKLIDFGTATPSFHPDKGVILSSGLVGSDPYVAPEVIRGEMYDARRADVWSAGIIFLAMMLRRFPWALADPRKDLNYRKFASTLHELPARPRSPLSRKPPATPSASLSGTPASAPAPGPGSRTKKPPPPPRTQKSGGDEGFESSASSAYDVPAPSLFGPGEGSITTFTTADSSLVLTPSDTGGSAGGSGSGAEHTDSSGAPAMSRDESGSGSAAGSGSGNWVDEPHLERYENWEEVIERLCAERSESESSSRSSLRSGGGTGSFMSRRSASHAQHMQPPPQPQPQMMQQNGLLAPPPPIQQVRREASEPVLGSIARPALGAGVVGGEVRPGRSMLGEGLSTSPISSPTHTAPQNPFAASTPALTLPPMPVAQERITIHTDNTLSYLPAETRWTILRMLQIEPQSRCSMADLLYTPPPPQHQHAHQLPPSPPQSPPRSSAASTHEHPHPPPSHLTSTSTSNPPGLQDKLLPPNLQMTPARRATAPVLPRKRQDPSVDEIGRDWLRSVVPCSEAEAAGVAVDHVHVRLKPTAKESKGGKWWRRS